MSDFEATTNIDLDALTEALRLDSRVEKALDYQLSDRVKDVVQEELRYGDYDLLTRDDAYEVAEDAIRDSFDTIREIAEDVFDLDTLVGAVLARLSDPEVLRPLIRGALFPPEPEAETVSVQDASEELERAVRETEQHPFAVGDRVRVTGKVPGLTYEYHDKPGVISDVVVDSLGNRGGVMVAFDHGPSWGYGPSDLHQITKVVG